jgi:predicted anti-sigma-YlaC factor YlaD
MDCEKAERLLLCSFDGRLEAGETIWLQDHIKGCPACQKTEQEYRVILSHLKKVDTPEPLPYFKERLLAKLQEKEKALPVLFWQRWATKALAFSLTAFILIGAGFLVFRTPEPQEMSQVEALLLRDENPLTETTNILEAKGPDNGNMMLIFSSMEEKDSARR